MNVPYYGQGGGNRTPNIQSFMQETQAELRKLWLRLQTRDTTPKVTQEKAWSYSGTVAPTATIDGQAWQAPANIIITELVLTLQDAGASSYTVSINVGGSFVVTSVIAAGSELQSEVFSVSAAKGTIIYPRLNGNVGGTGKYMGIVLRYTAV